MTASTQVSTTHELTSNAADEETHSALMTASTQVSTTRQLTSHAGDEEINMALMTASTQVSTTGQLTSHVADEKTHATPHATVALHQKWLTAFSESPSIKAIYHHFWIIFGIHKHY